MSRKTTTTLLGALLLTLTALFYFGGQKQSDSIHRGDWLEPSQSVSLKDKSRAEIPPEAVSYSDIQKNDGFFVKNAQDAQTGWSYSRQVDVLERFDHKMPTLLKSQLAYLREHPEADTGTDVIVRVHPDYLAEAEALGFEALPLVNAYVAQLRAGELLELLKANVVEYVTFDAVVRPSGIASSLSELRSIVGADQLKKSGKGVVVAVFDSGVADHEDLHGSKVKVAVDFTDDDEESVLERSGDRFGHGTHVAGIIGGDGKSSKEKHRGVGKGNKIVDLKVINDEGWGKTSALIRAIDWVIEHKDEYKIKVANLSLGHAPFESYTKDPLCQAVRQMVQSGIVTVVSAGNLGRTEAGEKIWGGITSPGTEPSVITVGAVNTNGTLTHADDIATTFSSRGPSIDGLFKPDISAPGNVVPSTLAADSYIAENYPELKVSVEEADDDDGEYITLSGSSMAAAFVTGTVTQMLHANKDLTPDMVKLILLMTAIKLDQPHMLEQGNGLLNSKTAVELAEEIDVEKQHIKKEVEPFWMLGAQDCEKQPEACEMVWAGGAMAFANRVVYSELVDPEVNPLWGEGIFWPEGIFWSDRTQAEGILWGDQLFGPEGIYWSDRVESNGIYWSDRSTQAHVSGQVSAQSVFWGDRLRGFLNGSSEEDSADFSVERRSVFWGNRLKGFSTSETETKPDKDIKGGGKGFQKSVFWGNRLGNLLGTATGELEGELPGSDSPKR